MGITKKGLIWEILNSFWIIFSFTILLSGIGQVVAGYKVRKKPWVIEGFIVFVLVYLSIEMNNYIPVHSSKFGVLFLIVWMVCIFRSFKIRKEYLIRLEIMQDSNYKEKDNNILKERIRNEYYGNKNLNNLNEDVRNTFNNEIEKDDNIYKEDEICEKNEKELIDINICSLEDFKSIPGFTIVTAKKAIQIREEKSGFKDVDDFLKELSIKDFYVDKIKNMIICTKILDKESLEERKLKGRTIDF